jgi:uncharacterized membrane protein YphA (DoxX/SURF4 family)
MSDSPDKGKQIGVYLFRHRYLTLVSRLLLGGIFIFAGVFKLPHILTLIWEIEQYQILSGNLAILYGYALPPLEIILGSLLVLGILTRIGASISGLLVLSFAIAKISAFARGLGIDICPCFGPVMPLLATHSLALDFVLLALATQIISHRGEFLSVNALFSAKKRGASKR